MVEPNSKANEPKRAKGSVITNYFLLILFIFGCIQFFINVQQDNNGDYHQKKHIEAFQRKHFDKARLKKLLKFNKKMHDLNEGGNHETIEVEEEVDEQNSEEEEDPLERERETLVGLNCDPHGGPSNDLAEEMVFWEDIPSDNTYISPFQKEGKKQYLTFESDHGGWNNIRMAMETVMTMAIAMGRTLVLPPEQPMYLLTKGQDHKGSNQRKDFTFSHFFEMDLIADEHMGLEIISMDEFLKREGLTGNLRDVKTGEIVFPPNNRTSYDGASHSIISNELEKYLQRVGMVPPWDPEKCMMAFPSTTDQADVDVLQDLHRKATSTKMPSFQEFIDRPNPVNAPAFERLKENWADRQGLCIYDKQWQDASLIHFGEGYDEKGARLLVHFYAFLFFEDWRHDTWMKRFVRDHIRYIDEIQCAAARIVAALRERVRSRGQKDGKYNAFHIRRGDFQYTVTRFDAPHIIKNAADQMPPNITIYIASDEKDSNFFKPFRELYDVVFLDDFKHLLEGVNTNYYGMIDSLIASRSETFFGCWFSTFTGYINRIRGYHNNKKKGPGYEMGYMKSYYYALDDRKDHLQHFYPVKKSFYAREFPTSWRLIDEGIGELKHLTTNKE